MMTTFKLVIEYDGTTFAGWQRQKDQPTIQGTIENALSKILNQPITIAGSGRTDAGVHALGQTASFTTQTSLACSAIKRGLNSIIKKAIVIKDCSIEKNDFHAQFSCISKEYQYHILNRPDPCAIGAQYKWHIRKQLNIELMNQCCDLITGIFDFKSFENTGSPRASTVRQIFSAKFTKNEDQLIFTISGSGFLKYMVRNIVGTMIWVGIEKITPKEFEQILLSKDRTQAGPTAPAHGLFLKKVNYS